jgi:phosphohistidine phosphatase
MKTLLLLRHAKSSWDDPDLDDHDRPLNKRGKKTAPRMGKVVRREELVPDLVLCSTALRARKTAEAVLDETEYEGDVRFDRRLYLGGPSSILTALTELGDEAAERVMVVGHNPDLEELVRALTGRAEPFPTATLARIDLPIARWRELAAPVLGRLVAVWRPRELDD